MSDWIEFHQALTTHRKTSALAGILGVRNAHAAGHLAFLWCWAVDNAPSGDITDVNLAAIARAADWPKKPETLISALVAAGFVDDNGGRLTLHDWDEYAGRLIAKRARNKLRMRCARNGHNPCVCNARATHVQDTCADTVQTCAGLPAPAPAPAPLRNQHQHQAPAPAPDGAQAPGAGAAAPAPPGDDDPPPTLFGDSAAPATRCYRAWQDQSPGGLNRVVQDNIDGLLSAGVPAPLIEEACRLAGESGGNKPWRYVSSIIQRLQEGRAAPSADNGVTLIDDTIRETLARRKARTA
ncbi:MAG: hypothetical protein KGK07_15695 [Chloroflexota bacterium]|nr:hypothetical protein [Chloroflexota bacterium]